MSPFFHGQALPKFMAMQSHYSKVLSWRKGLFFNLIPTSHFSTAGCWTQLEPLDLESAFWASLSPVPSSVEWSWDWLPWCPLMRCWECWLPWIGLLGSWLISLLSARFSSSTSRTRSSRASVEDWGSSGERGSGFTEDEKTVSLKLQFTFGNTTQTLSFHVGICYYGDE